VSITQYIFCIYKPIHTHTHTHTHTCMCVCIYISICCGHVPSGVRFNLAFYEEEDTCMSHEEEDTCMSYEEEDTCD